MTITQHGGRFDCPPHADDRLRLTLEGLLEHANLPQLWWIFLDDGDGVVGPLMPVAGYPDDPCELVKTGDMGVVPVVHVLAERVGMLKELVGASSAVLVWERPGPDELTDDTRLWAREMALACRGAEVRLRMQLWLHDDGLDVLTPDDYV